MKAKETIERTLRYTSAINIAVDGSLLVSEPGSPRIIIDVLSGNEANVPEHGQGVLRYERYSDYMAVFNMVRGTPVKLGKAQNGKAAINW